MTPSCGAEFSADRRYRYALWRIWGTGTHLLVIGLNPSVADETRDDPTVRRCIAYVRARGHDAVCIPLSAFDGEMGYEWVAGTFGEPQMILLEPGRAVLTPC